MMVVNKVNRSFTTQPEKHDLSFPGMQLKTGLLSGISDYGLETLSTAQSKSIPAIWTGHDVIIQSRAGTGKTIAIIIDILQRVNPDIHEVQGALSRPERKHFSQSRLPQLHRQPLSCALPERLLDLLSTLLNRLANI
jgi:superfamily II DNA/RNA helicase